MIKKTLYAALLWQLASVAHADGWMDTLIACHALQESKIPLACRAVRDEDDATPTVTFMLHASMWAAYEDLLTNSMAEVTMPVCLQQTARIVMVLITNDAMTAGKGNLSVCINGEIQPGTWMDIHKNSRTGEWELGDSF